MSNKDVAALVIWWCEGAKIRKDKRWKNSYLYPIEVTNTNFKVIKIFLDFLIREYEIPIGKFKGQLQIHEGDNVSVLEKYWTKKLGLKFNQLNKTIIRKKGKKPNKTRGTFKIRLYGKNIFLDLQKKLDELIAGV